MKFTQVASDAFHKLQLNAGVILTEFDPTSPTLNRSKILIATSGGVSFATNPEYIDFGEDIDNVPPNTKQLKVLQSVNPVMSGTGKTADTNVAKVLIGAADVTANTGKIVPRAQLVDEDFIDDLWWVGDYSDKNGATNGGFMAVHMMNVLSTSGLSIQSNDDGKGDFEFELTAHYDLEDIDTLPHEVYVKTGSAEPSA
jgi:hypothetical protein